MSQDYPRPGHTFQPYEWDKFRCGYVDHDDVMCGYRNEEHSPSTEGDDTHVDFYEVGSDTPTRLKINLPETGSVWPRMTVGTDDDGLSSHGPLSYRAALDKHIEEDPDLVKAKEGIDQLVAHAQEGWSEAAKARRAAAWGWAMACLFLVVSLAILLVLLVTL
jgi:hypothetical protein